MPYRIPQMSIRFNRRTWFIVGVCVDQRVRLLQDVDFLRALLYPYSTLGVFFSRKK